MRRHVLLMILVVVLIVALALVRGRSRATEYITRPAVHAPPTVVSPEETVAQDPIDNKVPGPDQVVTGPFPGQTSTVSTPPPARQRIRKHGHELVTVLGNDGKPVSQAVVFFVSFLDPRTPVLPPAIHVAQTDDEGTLEFALNERKYVKVLSYKPGLGASPVPGYEVVTKGVNQTVKFLSNISMKVQCVETNGAPVEKAEVTIVTELHLANRAEEEGTLVPVFVPLPPRTAITDRTGKCEIDALIWQGPWTNIRGTTIPGCKYSVKAKWRDLSSPEQTFEELPHDSVLLVLSVLK